MSTTNLVKEVLNTQLLVNLLIKRIMDSQDQEIMNKMLVLPKIELLLIKWDLVKLELK